jgi:hypothetical protein
MALQPPVIHLFANSLLLGSVLGVTKIGDFLEVNDWDVNQ